MNTFHHSTHTSNSAPRTFIRGFVSAALLGLLVTVSACASPPRPIDTSRAAGIQPGMSQTDVQQMLGRPAYSQRYALNQTTTWTYYVDQVSDEQVIFDVDFDAQGHVIARGERRLLAASPS